MYIPSLQAVTQDNGSVNMAIIIKKAGLSLTLLQKLSQSRKLIPVCQPPTAIEGETTQAGT